MSEQERIRELERALEQEQKRRRVESQVQRALGKIEGLLNGISAPNAKRLKDELGKIDAALWGDPV